METVRGRSGNIIIDAPQLLFNRDGLSRANTEIAEIVPNSSFPDPLIKSEGRGIQYFLESKVTGFPLEFTLVKTGAGMTLKQDFFSNLLLFWIS
jgi:hypothetical protein